MNECEEVAAAMRAGAPAFESFCDAVAYVRRQMPGESSAVIDNVADALYRGRAA